MASPGLWIQAARPRTLTAALAPVWMGIGYAIWQGQARALPALAALMGAILIQVGTNLANDYYDHVRGGDTADRVGPVRVTQAGLIEPVAVRNAAFLTFGAALGVGVYLVAVGGWPIVVIGLLSVASGLAYTAGPFPLAYNGLGDLFVLVFFGPVAVGGTYWVQALEWRTDLLVAGLGVGALSTAILAANNLRDLETDRVAGKRTLPVLLGRGAGRAEYALMVAVGATALIGGVLAAGWPPLVLLGLIGVVATGPALRRVLTEQEARAVLPALPITAQATGLYGVLAAIGFALG